MLKQNVAERLFMEGPGQEKGTAVETAVLIAYAVFCAWGLVRMAAQAASGDRLANGIWRAPSSSSRSQWISSLTTVRALGDTLRDEGVPIGLLVNNAGVMTPPRSEERV